jgi:glycerophosphoryl diester phosphodiesterase
MLKFLRNLLFLIVLLTGAFIAVYLILRTNARPADNHPWVIWSRAEQTRRVQPLVFAHQGGEGIRPSNTLLAFDHAVALGADVLDADMHMTKDGVLVLIHDQTVERTTDGAGALRDLTTTQLALFDAAYAFSPDNGATFPYRGQGHTIPTLESLFQKHPDKRYGIEIKQTPPDVAVPFCRLIRQYSMQDKVLVSSFRQENMDAFRRECPEVATSATQDEATLFVVLSLLRLEHVVTPAYETLQVPQRSSGIDVLTPRFIDAARNRNVLVQPWTINAEEDLRRIVALGVDGINTDYPDRLLRVLGR